MSQQAKDFIGKIGPDVVQACINTGLFPSVVIAQGIQESDSGRSKLAQMGNNLFGHMASASWLGKTFQTVTGGRLWRAYNSVFDCIKAHIEILKKPKYRLAGTLKAQSPFDQVTDLQKAGYDVGPDRPRYAQKLTAIIKAYNLQQYDSQMLAMERAANPNGLAYSEQPAVTRILHNLIG